MSIENGMRPEGAENFKAPEDKPKKKTLFQKMRSSKIARTLGLGAALAGGAIMSQEKAQAMDGRDAIWAAQNTARDVMQYKAQKARIEAQKQRDAQRHQEEIQRNEQRHQEQMEREANRARQDQLRKQEQQEREKTQRQDNALRTAERTGATKIKTATVGEDTEVSLTPGATPEERMQAEKNLHEKEMKEMDQRQELRKTNPYFTKTVTPEKK